MSTLIAIFLGLLQGLTEFLPVSSSGHLVLAQKLLGLDNLSDFIAFDLVCHLGTLVAILIFFYKDILNTLFENRARAIQIALATLPLFPLVLLLKPIKSLFNQTEYLGFFFLITALLLYIGIRFGSVKPPATLQKKRFRDALIIGLFQAGAILPGVSRSGSTLSAAKLLGWQPSQAIAFSFLLAIPAILGGSLVEMAQMFTKAESAPLASISFFHYFLGFTTSMFMGGFSLQLLKRLAMKQQLMYFVWYCLLLGIFTIIYFNMSYL
jgi:undecaprenyl-diphosphatase